MLNQSVVSFTKFAEWLLSRSSRSRQEHSLYQNICTILEKTLVMEYNFSEFATYQPATLQKLYFHCACILKNFTKISQKIFLKITQSSSLCKDTFSIFFQSVGTSKTVYPLNRMGDF